MATGYNRVYNTEISGISLISNLSGDDATALAYMAATNELNPVVTTADTTITLNPEDWVQAAISTLMLNSLAVFSYNAVISLGPDSFTGASYYVQLFNFQEAGDTILLKFGSYGLIDEATILLANSSTGPETASNVIVNVQNIGSPTGAAILFNGTGAVGVLPQAGNGSGIERLVLVEALNVEQGFEAVQFNILPWSV